MQSHDNNGARRDNIYNLCSILIQQFTDHYKHQNTGKSRWIIQNRVVTPRANVNTDVSIKTGKASCYNYKCNGSQQGFPRSHLPCQQLFSIISCHKERQHHYSSIYSPEQCIGKGPRYNPTGYHNSPLPSVRQPGNIVKCYPNPRLTDQEPRRSWLSSSICSKKINHVINRPFSPEYPRGNQENIG